MSKRTPVLRFAGASDQDLGTCRQFFAGGALASGSGFFKADLGLGISPLLGRVVSAVAGSAGVLVLAGCASVGSFAGLPSVPAGVDTSLFTASTGTAVEEQLDQEMPAQLQGNGQDQGAGSGNGPAGGSSGPYLPPGNVGGSVGSSPFAVASVPRSQLPPPVPGNSALAGGAAGSAPLQTTSVGSQQTMSAQTQTAIPAARVTQPFQDNPVPRVASPGGSPSLGGAPGGVYRHKVESGESLYAIARRYNVKTDDIVRANSLTSADQIFVGQQLIIPGREDLLAAGAASSPAQVLPLRPNDDAAASKPEQAADQANTPRQPARVASISPTPPAEAARNNPASVDGAFRWPVNGRVIVDFEQSRRTGINIEAPEGAAVRAAEDGVVIYAGDGIEGFGNLILVRHANGYVSAYAHLKGFSVSRDDQVRRGDQIGTVGMTGSVSRPQLHFELRQGATPVDPMPLLAS